MVFPGVSVVKNPPTRAADTGEIPESEDPLGEEMATHSSILMSGEFHGLESGVWRTRVRWVTKSWTQMSTYKVSFHLFKGRFPQMGKVFPSNDCLFSVLQIL